MTEKELLKMIGKYLDQPGNNAYHVSLEDGNMQDGNIKFCLSLSKTEVEKTIGNELLKMSVDERWNLRLKVWKQYHRRADYRRKKSAKK